MELCRKMDVQKYLEQFGIIGKDGDLNCDNLSQILYATILNKFKITMDKDEYAYFREYQERIFDLIENMREFDIKDIDMILAYINKIDHYLCDIIIMIWCLPRVDTYHSKKIYQKNYKHNILKYNNKLCQLIHHDVIKNFCIETLTKTNNVPVHCIDYIWFYMKYLEIDLVFYNANNGDYIGFQIFEVENKKEHMEFDFSVELGFNMEYLLSLGLGHVKYIGGHNGTFCNFMESFLQDISIVNELINQQNFICQFRTILSDPKKYFGRDIKFSEEILQLLN